MYFGILKPILSFSDSLYMALSADSLDDVIKPGLENEWFEEKKRWFPRTDTPENIQHDKRTPGTVLHVFHFLKSD